LFNHLIKDYRKKLDDIERRLEVSLDRDEVQTLGLKLRFHYNEVKHYRKMMREVFDRIAEIQDKYGFVHEEAPAEAPEREKLRAAPEAEKSGDAASLVSDWIARLEKKGIDPKALLRGDASSASELERKQDKTESAARAEEKQPEPAAAERVSSETKPPAQPQRITGVNPNAAAKSYIKTQTDLSGASAVEKLSADAVDAYIPSGADYRDAEETPLFNETAAEPKQTEQRLDAEPIAQQPATAVDAISQADIDAFEVADEPAQPNAPAPSLADKLTGWAAKLAAGESEESILHEMQAAADDSETAATEVSDWLDKVREVRADPAAEDAAALAAAWLLKLSGRPGMAMNALETAVKKNGGSPEANKLLGDLYRQRGMSSRAADCYGAAIRAGTEDPDVETTLFECLKQAERWDDISDHIDGMEMSDDAELVLLKSEALQRTGRADEALKLLEALAESEADPRSRTRALTLLARALESKGDILGAIDCFEKSFEIVPDNPESRYELGKLYISHNAVPLARNELMALAKRHPESEWADKARELMAREGIN